ncbi:unnamed protein product [Adineta steineri]|uniref:Uncharacterized protein n=1 Tax=Adineta steineri TaxID=433720 RepID=A0A819SLR5_9BILA|nr:unnamed protein product [Adineta steineri]CAF4064039.1 unnamed protein product [Adineta steineri]
MQNNLHISTIFPVESLVSNQYEVELNDIRMNHDNYTINSTTNLSCGKFKSFTKFLKTMLKKYNCIDIETRGIERILSEERTDCKTINIAMMWFGANIIIPSFASGILGPALFKLSLYESFLTIIVGTLLGIIPVAAIACFGPASGLRTMVYSRYSWGYYGASIMSIFSIIVALGWAAISSIRGAQTLRVVFNDSIPMAVGIVIISIISMIVSFVGYKWLHIYERYSWIPVFIAYCVLAGVGATYFTSSTMVSINATTLNNSSSRRAQISRILSFGATCFSISSSWCTCAADYNTYFSEDTSQLKIFILTYIGNFLPMALLQLLGAAAYTGTYTNQDWNHAYEINSVGGLLGASLLSLGVFGKFLLLLFALSTIGCNILNIYSLSLSGQVVGPIFKRIPRFLYTVVGTIIYILLAIVAANKFNDSLTSLLSLTSYWSVIFVVIVVEEHLLFRRYSFKNYNFDIWNNRKSLSIGIAAILSGLVGIVGIALGMTQTWFTGSIAKAIAGDSGEQGTDVGLELGFVFTAVSFPLFRSVELYFIRK